MKIRSVLKAVKIVLLVIVMIPVVLLGAIQLPKVQQALSDKAAKILYEKTGIEAGIGRVSIKNFLDISLQDIKVIDTDRDTVLRAGELLVSADLSMLRDSTARLKELRLKDIYLDSKEMLGSTSVTGSVGFARIRSDSTSLSGRYTRLSELLLSDTDVTLVLEPDEDTTASAPFEWRADIESVVLDNIRFRMPSAGLDLQVGNAGLKGSADLGAQIYHADSLGITDASVTIGGASYALHSLNARGGMDGQRVDVPEFSVLTTGVGLEGRAALDLDDILGSADYDATVTLDGAKVSDFIGPGINAGATGVIKVSGHGADPLSGATSINAKGSLGSAFYEGARLKATSFDVSLRNGRAGGTVQTDARYSADSLSVAAAGRIGFRAEALTSSRPAGSLQLDLHDIRASKDTLSLDLDSLALDASTSRAGTAADISVPGINLKASAGGHVLDLLPLVGQIPGLIPEDIMQIDLPAIADALPEADVALSVLPDNPLQEMISSFGVAFDSLGVNLTTLPGKGLTADIYAAEVAKDSLSLDFASLRLDQSGERLNCNLEAATPPQLGIPAVEASASGYLGTAESKLRIQGHTAIRDSIMGVTGINTGVNVDVTAAYDGLLSATGQLGLKGLEYASQNFGDPQIRVAARQTDGDRFDIRAVSDLIPVAPLKSFVPVEGVGLDGAVKLNAHLTGPLDSLSIAAEVTPKNISAYYEPFQAGITLSDDPIRFEDMTVLLDGNKVFAADSTFITLDGGVALEDMAIDVAIASDRFVPLLLDECDSIPASGNAAAALALRLQGTPDSLLLGGDVEILPETSVRYDFAKDSYVSATPSGKVSIDYPLDGEISLKGRVDIGSGQIKYALPLYPLAPFSIDPGSNVRFDGPLDKMRASVTASQKAKATVSKNGDRSRSVDFNVGLQIKGGLQDLGLHFLMEAPNDEEVQTEIDNMSTDERDRVAAALLVTGMYTSDTNTEVAQSGYALSSIVQRGLNTIAGNTLGDLVDIDLGMATRSDGDQTTQDYKMKLSKSFFGDRIKLSVGGRLSTGSDSEGGSSSESTAALDEVTAEYVIDPKTSVYLFHKQDYENIMDGELTKEGLGVRTSIKSRIDLEGDVSYRSNMQIGPHLAATYSRRNLLGKNETISAKLHGAYYWKIVDRNGAGNDNFTVGANVSMGVPFNRRNTRKYSVSYLHESVASDFTKDKLGASFGFTFRPSQYVYHEFTPASISLVKTTMSTEYGQSGSIHSLMSTFLNDEYIPAMSYKFTYDNFADKSRKVNTSFSGYVKESGALIGGLQAAFGKDWNEEGKEFLFGSYDQFLKVVLELRNNFAIGQKCRLATRLLGGSILGYGNSSYGPSSEQFYAGGPSGLRAFAPRSIGPGGYWEPDYNLNFYHAGDIRAEANVEFRFPLFWLLEGAVFVDAGNVWSRDAETDGITEEDLEWLRDVYGLRLDYDDSFNWNNLGRTTAVGTGFGVRLVFQSIVIRLDTAFPLHYPYDTGVDRWYNVDKFFRDGIRLNFGIGYPF